MEQVRERRQSLFGTFKDAQKLDIRAHQRTYEGAYMRASIAVMVFALMITKMFSHEFLPIATVYTIYGSLIFLVAISRMNHMKNYYEETNGTLLYKTSGNIVLRMGLISLCSYIAMLVLILRM